MAEPVRFEETLELLVEPGEGFLVFGVKVLLDALLPAIGSKSH